MINNKYGYIDELTIYSFEFIVYFLRIKENITKDIKYPKFLTLVNNYASKSPAIFLSFKNINPVEFRNLFSLFYDDLLSEDISLEKGKLRRYIMSYLNREKKINKDIEEVENVICKPSGDILIVSPLVKEYLFSLDFTSITFDFYSYQINLLMSSYFEINNVKYNNCLSIEDLTGKFDYIYFCPAYNEVKRFREFYSNNQKNKEIYEYQRLLSISKHLDKNGTIVSLIASKNLSNGSKSKSKRELLEKGLINFVLELPILDAFQYPLSLMLLNKGNDKVKFSNASKSSLSLRRGSKIDKDKILRSFNGLIEGEYAELDFESLEDKQFDLLPRRLITSASINNEKDIKLSELTEIIYRGYQVTSKEIEELESHSKTPYKLLTLSDIEDGRIKEDSMISLKEIPKAMNHYRLQENDLVISTKGKTFKTAVVSIPYSKKYVSTGSLVVIRCKKDILDPYYLKIYLDSDDGVSELKKIQSSGQILSLNPTNLCDLKIPLISLQNQLEISSSYRFKIKSIDEVKEIYDDMKAELIKKYSTNFKKLINIDDNY